MPVGPPPPPPALAVYVSSFYTNSILKYDAGTGQFLSIFATDNPSGLIRPRGLAFGPDGKLYVASMGNNRILRFNADGSFDAVFSSDNRLLSPWGIVFDINGKLLAACSGGDNNPVSRFNADGSLDTAFAANANLSGATALDIDTNGQVYVAGDATGNIVRYNTDGTFDRVFVSGLSHPRALAIGPNTDLFVTGQDWSFVRRYDAVTGSYKQLFAAAGGIIQPGAVIFDATNANMYVASGLAPVGAGAAGGSAILRYDGSDGSSKGIFASGGGLDYPAGLVFH